MKFTPLISIGIILAFFNVSLVLSEESKIFLGNYNRNNMKNNIRTKIIASIERNLNQNRTSKDNKIVENKLANGNVRKKVINEENNNKNKFAQYLKQETGDRAFERNNNQSLHKMNNVDKNNMSNQANFEANLNQTQKNTKNIDIKIAKTRDNKITTSRNRNYTNNIEINQTNARNFESQEALVINLEEINRMSIFEFLKRKLRSIWTGEGSKTIPHQSFLGRCIGIAKKLNRLIPIVMVGLGIIGTTLGFLTLFSLKSLALLGLLVMMNVASGAAKLGALFAAKKHDTKPQVMHFHVHPEVVDHHTSDHHGFGPHSSYWEDRNDFDISKLERKDLYNLYDKLKAEEYRKQHYYS